MPRTMPVISSMNVALSTDEVLERLPLSSPAFSTRPAPAVISDILNTIEKDRLVEPRASFGFHDVDRVDGTQLKLKCGAILTFEKAQAGIDDADRVVAAAWSLGSRASTAISNAFSQRQFLSGFLLHEIASLLLFRLGENLFDLVSEKTSLKEMNIGRIMAPGDSELALPQQAGVLTLAQGERIGIELSGSGALMPAMSATAVAMMGCRIRRPKHRWSCNECRVRATCRLRLR